MRDAVTNAAQNYAYPLCLEFFLGRTLRDVFPLTSIVLLKYFRAYTRVYQFFTYIYMYNVPISAVVNETDQSFTFLMEEVKIKRLHFLTNYTPHPSPSWRYEYAYIVHAGEILLRN